jgi:hypothetical protein
MDFAFAYILIAFVTLAVKVAFVLAGAFSILVVLFVARDVWRFIQDRRPSGDRS